MKSILVWDIPTRLFHWLLALSFTVAFVTAEVDGLRVLHVFAGLVLLGLIAFRMVWGLVGTRYARFSSFLFSPLKAVSYLMDTLQGKAERHIGHNPAGSWAIFLLLVLCGAIGVTGLMLLSQGERFEEVHEVLAFGALTVVVLHVAGVIVESLAHKENLPKAMVTGRKEGAEEQGIRSARPVAALVMTALLTVFSATYWQGWNPQDQTVKLPFLSQPLSLGEGGEGGGHSQGHDDDD